MSQDKDYQTLARKFMDMWQQQMAAMVNDSDFVHQLLQMMQHASFSGKDASSYAPHHNTEPAGSTASAPDAGARTLDRIERSLAAIEERLVQLERLKSSQKRFSRNRKTRTSVVRTATRPRARTGGGKRSKKKSR